MAEWKENPRFEGREVERGNGVYGRNWPEQKSRENRQDAEAIGRGAAWPFARRFLAAPACGRRFDGSGAGPEFEGVGLGSAGNYCGRSGRPSDRRNWKTFDLQRESGEHEWEDP